MPTRAYLSTLPHKHTDASSASDVTPDAVEAAAAPGATASPDPLLDAWGTVASARPSSFNFAPAPDDSDSPVTPSPSPLAAADAGLSGRNVYIRFLLLVATRPAAVTSMRNFANCFATDKANQSPA